VLAVDFSCETAGAPELGARDIIAWGMGEDVRADYPEDTLGEPILLWIYLADRKFDQGSEPLECPRC
jgi:hypothetical protein